jgi:hypothetical protein
MPTPTKKTPTKKLIVRTATKVVAKPAVKVASKPAAQTMPKPAQRPVVSKARVTAKPATPKAEKIKKPKMVRDSISIPKAEYAVLDALKIRCASLSKPVKKTELLRAGIKALAAMSDAALLAAVGAVPNLKTGRPANVK